MNQLFYNIAGGIVHKIRRKKRTTKSEAIVRGKREILSKINKIGIYFISIFLLKAVGQRPDGHTFLCKF